MGGFWGNVFMVIYSERMRAKDFCDNEAITLSKDFSKERYFGILFTPCVQNLIVSKSKILIIGCNYLS